jgi:hypothetical protein
MSYSVKAKRKGPFGRQRCRRVDIIKLVLIDIVRSIVNSIDLVQDRDSSIVWKHGIEH